MTSRRMIAGTLALVMGAGACAHVGQDDFNTEMAALRAEMSAGDRAVEGRLSDRMDGLDARTAQLEQQMSDLELELRSLQEEFDVTVEQMEASLRFNTPLHFGFDQADVASAHEPLLERFASVVRDAYPNALITVEGFTDPSGSEAYNLKLGQRRADAVRSWLVGEGDMVGERVRAVSYGEDTSRLVRADAQGPGMAGEANRRVVFVVEHVAADRPIIADSETSGMR